MRRSLFGRTLGYAGLARSARKLKRDRDVAVRSNARLHIVARMGKLRGLPQKFGQMVSLRGDPESAPIYEKLTDSAQPLPWKRIKKVIIKAWGCPIEKHVRWMDPNGMAASLRSTSMTSLYRLNSKLTSTPRSCRSTQDKPFSELLPKLVVFESINRKYSLLPIYNIQFIFFVLSQITWWDWYIQQNRFN